MTHEQFIEPKTAKLAKQAGFDWECNERYNERYATNDSEPLYVSPRDNWNRYAGLYSAPTQSVLQRWLREIHHLHITIFSSSQESWMFRITKPHQMLEDGVYGEDFYSHEEAQEAGIKKALEIILEKGE